MKCTLLLLAIIIAVAASGQTAGRYEVVIDEIMADPSPQVGLPNNEWIELKNTSLTAFNLQGWRIEDASGLSGPMPSFMLEPDSFVIVCAG
ncbi:MAG TPA: lamin tail domain-containing protein, partial [Chitinophagaceae bacterium]